MTTAEDLGIQGIEEVEPLDVDGSVIFRARQTAYSRRVAVKILDPYQEPLVPRRFDLRRKPLTKFAERVGVVPVYQVGTTPRGQQYLLMPYFDTGSLADQFANGPMPWRRAADLIKSTAETVAEAHDLGLVLGDIKPSSIMLSDASATSIAVYGMATRRFDDGRPSYGAPEIKPGTQATAAADVFSLCLSLVALIHGQPPTRGQTTSELLNDFEGDSPEWLIDVVTKGLSKSPLDRYNDARVLAATLATGLSTESRDPVAEAAPVEGLTLNLDELLDNSGQGDVLLHGLNLSQADADGEPSDPFDFEALLELPTYPSSNEPRPSLDVDAFLNLDDVLDIEDVGGDIVLSPETEKPTAPETESEGAGAPPSLPDNAAAVPHLDDLLSDDGAIDLRGRSDQANDHDPMATAEVATPSAGDDDPTKGTRSPPPSVLGGLGTDWQSASETDMAAAVLQGQPPLPGQTIADARVGQPETDAETESRPEAASPTTLFDEPRVAGPAAPTTSGAFAPNAPLFDDVTSGINTDGTVANEFVLPNDATNDLFGAPTGGSERSVPSSFRRPPAEPPAQSIWDAVPASGLSDQVSHDATMEVPVTRIDEPDAALFPPRTALYVGPTSGIGDPSLHASGQHQLRDTTRAIRVDESVPFGGFERRTDDTMVQGGTRRVMDGMNSLLVDRRPGVTGLLAVVAFVMIAGAVVTLLVRDFRPATTTTTDADSPSTSISVISAESGSNPISPTSVPPVLPEPASTHNTQASRGTARRLTTTIATTVPPPTSAATTGAPTSDGGSTTAATEATTVPAPITTPTTASATTGSENALPPLGPTTRAQTAPEGLPEPSPLIRNAAVSRIGSSSARIAFDSPRCVTVLFSFSAAGGPTSQLSGGSRCASGHTLLLGTVTPPLEPGTTYTVVITASAGSDAERTVLRFTTQK